LNFIKNIKFLLENHFNKVNYNKYNKNTNLLKYKGYKMLNTEIEEMFLSNVHFGHQTSRWNPKMSKYIFAPRNGIHIIDLRKTIIFLKKAIDYVIQITSEGHKILFIGTKKQAQSIILNECSKNNQFYINHRWLGGTLTNFNTIKKSVDKMKQLDVISNDGTFDKLLKKEIATITKDFNRLKKNLIGIKNMSTLPTALFIIDPRFEKIAVKEANILNIPIIALTDTNCNPDLITYPIPANDDSVKSINLFTKKILNACNIGNKIYQSKLLKSKFINNKKI